MKNINVELQDMLEETPYGIRADVIAWAINEYDSFSALQTLVNEGVEKANVEHVLGQKNANRLFTMHSEEVYDYCDYELGVDLTFETVTKKEFDKLRKIFPDLPSEEERIQNMQMKVMEKTAQAVEADGLNEEEEKEMAQILTLGLLFTFSDEEKVKVVQSAYQFEAKQIYDELFED